MKTGVRAEGQDLEFKRSVSNYNDIGQTACAFANSIGGNILVGVDDTGKVVGIDRDVLDPCS
jgi:predicted HTH transcriptional regulator